MHGIHHYIYKLKRALKVTQILGGLFYNSWPSKSQRCNHSPCDPLELVFKVICIKWHAVSVPLGKSSKLSSIYPKANFLLQCNKKCDIHWNAPWALRTIVEPTWTWQLNGQCRECASLPQKQELRSINQISSMEKKERKKLSRRVKVL